MCLQHPVAKKKEFSESGKLKDVVQVTRGDEGGCDFVCVCWSSTFGVNVNGKESRNDYKRAESHGKAIL